MQLSASMATVVALFSLLDKGSQQFYEAGAAAVQIVPDGYCLSHQLIQLHQIGQVVFF